MTKITPNKRFLVPDLSPKERPALSRMKVKFVFVAESPHVNEIEPDALRARRPLCGAAGRKWWGMISKVLEGVVDEGAELERQLSLCRKHGIVVMNAVQYPLDPKIIRHVEGAEPLRNLGFSKAAGHGHYRRLKESESVRTALLSLKKRLMHSSVRNAPIIPLGNDALWFVEQALAASGRLSEKIPHPAAWWRRGGLYGRVAEERLRALFK